jgi:hypothetical protein
LYSKQIKLFQKEVNMRKGLLAICLILLISLAVLAPSCTKTTPTTTGTITVKATLCGSPWPGAGTGLVNYSLTPASGSPISGNNVTASFTVNPSDWTCTYANDGSGPAGAFLVDITPPSSQTVSAGGTKTFTLNFELNQDAAIRWLNWTVNGEIWESSTLEVGPCNVTDVHFQQWVDGCPGYNATLNETDWLTITQVNNGLAPQAMIFVVNASCALNKTPDPQYKVFQMPSINNATAKVGDNITLVFGVPTLLDVETQWQLVKDLNYTKSINWLGISKLPFELPGPHPCVLFELVAPGPGTYQFTLQASAHVDLVGATDGNLTNNAAHSPLPPLTLIVNVGP